MGCVSSRPLSSYKLNAYTQSKNNNNKLNKQQFDKIVESSWFTTLELRSKTIKKQCFMFLLKFNGVFNRLDSFGPNFIYCSKPSCTLRSMMCASTWSSPIASYIWYVHSLLYFPFLFISSPCPIPDKMLISGGNSVGNH